MMSDEEIKRKGLDFACNYPTTNGKGYKRVDLRISYIKGYNDAIKDSYEIIEKMKCCNNCKHRYFMDFKSVCAFDKSDIKDIENPMTCKCNKWEIEG